MLAFKARPKVFGVGIGCPFETPSVVTMAMRPLACDPLYGLCLSVLFVELERDLDTDR